MPRCIYCLETRPAVDFTVDHVMPRMLGHFRGFPTLQDAVCGACNQYFGNEVEIVLGRDSHVGLQRLTLGQKLAAKATEFRGRLVELTVPPGSPWEDARLSVGPSLDQRSIVINLVPQIGIRREVELQTLQVVTQHLQLGLAEQLRPMHPQWFQEAQVALAERERDSPED